MKFSTALETAVWSNANSCWKTDVDRRGLIEIQENEEVKERLMDQIILTLRSYPNNIELNPPIEQGLFILMLCLEKSLFRKILNIYP